MEQNPPVIEEKREEQHQDQTENNKVDKVPEWAYIWNREIVNI